MMNHSPQFRNQYFVQVHNWETRLVMSRAILLVGINLLLTIAAAFAGFHFGAPCARTQLGWIIQTSLVPMLLLWILQAALRHEEQAVFPLAALSSYLGYFVLAPLSTLLHAEGLSDLLLQALGMTALATLSIGLYATWWGQTFKLAEGVMLSLAPILLIACVLNWIFQSPILSLVISAGAGIFSAWSLGAKLHQIVSGGERNAVSAAASLYLSIYNLFMVILRFLLWFAAHNRGSGSRRRR